MGGQGTLGPFGLEVVETPTLGDRSYLVHDGSVAAVIDPQRDLDRVTTLLDRLGVRLVAVLETHVHNDYLTGGLALARATGAAYHLNAADDVSFERDGLRDGDVVAVGERIRLTALATPGHTFTHLSYALTDDDAGLDEALAVFTGGSLLFGATGRPDLLGDEHTDALARHQHASAHRLADLLPASAEVLPTHGFGSFCAATQSEATASTIGDEVRGNPVLTQDEQAYVEDLLAGLGAYPAYYAHMASGNAQGPGAPDLSPAQEADPAELRRRLESGEWVVDLRDRRAFAAGHLRGSYNFGLDGGFATYLGWLVAWGTPLTLLGSTPEDVAEAQRELVRIGIDRPAAQSTGGPDDWARTPEDVRSFERGSFADLAQVRHHREVQVLDVRRDDERAEGAVVGSAHVPLQQLLDRIDDVPAGEVWVHCAAGYRASIAASLLDAAGRHVVAVDDDWSNAPGSGLPVAPGGRATGREDRGA
ncbi:MBL fold metallo-hydrolase [Nocardioides marmoribigeumensis]|uniref:Glyoxylase-like metal-dependent hydrolase (Beta-lactamase superfamily II)/rhodanese-related sulfurtransferase n=1 Tax=Nocardioides marmoribigeumensis TaxID=433649 RepID=A0ABU2BUC1_9ACTN|nr:MBL fold metallo-hydrolase [Nocardioides marmoribigeumensis]MDR7362220.1 glyoxylase-like metal-dependent hydrolase (beta-lactamase superfamily II)/rhodanese-related sulfurtransferase [Nocardioides marmoribigeumensis]